ncbi:MAG: IS200/IS605 family transposase [Phycisphaerales bacterium]
MSSAWTQLHCHLVWSTKHRQPFIDPALEPRLHAFLGGIIRDLECTPIEIGGVADHVHLLARVRADLTISDLVRHVKSRSSKWVHDTFPDRAHFAWQAGYGAFSVSNSMTEKVVKYIQRQNKHHESVSFESEFLSLLEKHGMNADRALVFQDER